MGIPKFTKAPQACKHSLHASEISACFRYSNFAPYNKHGTSCPRVSLLAGTWFIIQNVYSIMRIHILLKGVCHAKVFVMLMPNKSSKFEHSLIRNQPRGSWVAKVVPILIRDSRLARRGMPWPALDLRVTA